LREEERRAVGLTLRALAPRDQLLLRLIYQDGLSYADTARLLGVSPHSIAPLLQRARARFRDAAARRHPDLLNRVAGD
jgi:RNA polymerase sigma factor (sigma-70 family)